MTFQLLSTATGIIGLILLFVGKEQRKILGITVSKRASWIRKQAEVEILMTQE